MKILVIEDDETTGRYIVDGLKQEGHSVDLIGTGDGGLVQATVGQYDVIVVDRMLPGIDGLSVVKTLRGAGHTAPVLMLTALGGVDDRIEGLNAGADDYLVKPFAFGELSARIAALGRRPPVSAEPTVLTARDLEMNLLTRKVTRAGQESTCCPANSRCWSIFCGARAGCRRGPLLEAVWDIHFDPHTNVVETHVSRLRAKVDRPVRYRTDPDGARVGIPDRRRMTRLGGATGAASCGPRRCVWPCS